MQLDELSPKENISDTVAGRVRQMILDGRLPAGERVNEVHLARALGVSRTPLREGLAKLAQEGTLNAVPRIGYFVAPLTVAEFEQVYDIRPLLDPEALRLAGLPSPEKLERLRVLNDRIEKARSAEAAIDLDDAWHRELLSECPNKVLLEMIDQIILRTRRYEMALMKERRNVLQAGFDHRAIMTCLKKRDLKGACAALRQNMQTGRAPIVAWLTERENQKD